MPGGNASRAESQPFRAAAVRSPVESLRNTFLSCLLTQVYSLDTDTIYICGDFNSRISDKKDCIGDLDNIPPRVALDRSLNSQGESFLEFLSDSNCCVLNGRKNRNDDNFTSLSVRGKHVVDYIVTPHNCLESCLAFKVITATDLIEQNAATCMNLIGERCNLPITHFYC